MGRSLEWEHLMENGHLVRKTCSKGGAYSKRGAYWKEGAESNHYGDYKLWNWKGNVQCIFSSVICKFIRGIFLFNMIIWYLFPYLPSLHFKFSYASCLQEG